MTTNYIKNRKPMALRQVVIGISLLFSMVTVQAQVDLEGGLVAYYPFNGNADDESGYFNDGVTVNTVLTTDRFENADSAYDFSNAYISIQSSDSLESPTTELTMAAWVNTLPSDTFLPILMKSGSSANAFQYRMYVTQNGIGTSINDWDNGVGSSVPISPGEWHLVVATLKDGVVSGYLDGELIDTDNITGGSTINLDTHELQIGRDTPGATEYFEGKIDDVRIYNRAINAAEVAALFNENQYRWIFKNGFESLE